MEINHFIVKGLRRLPVPSIKVSPWLRAILICFWLGLTAHASEMSKWQLNTLQSPGEPLPGDRVTCMLRDRFGFLWMGTQRGLIRNHFTGFRWYRPNPGDSNSLVSGDIQVLLEDAAGRFWVGTNGGLHLLDRKTGQFRKIDAKLANGDPWPSQNIRILVEDGDGRLWIGTDKGLLVWADGEAVAFDKADGLPQSWVSDVVLGPRGHIWAVTREQGLFLLHGEAEGIWQSVATNWPRPILAVHRTQEGIWWIGTDSELFRSNRDPELKTVAFEPVLKESVSHFVEDGQGSLWMGQTRGLKRMAADGELLQIPLDGAGGTVGTQALIADNLGMVWVSLSNGGVKFWNSYRSNWWFQGLENAEVWSIESDGGHGVWLGTKYRGLLHIYPESKQETAYLSGQVIRGLHRDGLGNLWIGARDGLFRLAPGETEPVDLGPPFDERVWRVVRDGYHRLWLGMDSGLWVTQADHPKTRERPAWIESQPGLTQAVVTALTLDGDRLWVGTYSHGLYRIDLASKQVRPFNRDTDPALPSNEIVDVFADGNGQIWVCSVSGGMARLSPEGGLLPSPPQEGYREAAVVSLLQDRAGMLWANSGSGLIQFDAENGTKAMFSKDDGLVLQSAIPGSKLITGDGIWFGGTQGLVHFSPERMPEPERIPLAIPSVRIDGEEVSQLLQQGEPLVIGEDAGIFSLELAKMEPFPHGRGAWFYRRVSKDESWIELEGNILQLSRYLPLGGNDRIEIKGTDHLERPTRMQLDIKFLPPWWRIWLPVWTMVMVLLIVSGTYVLVSRAERERRKRLIEEAREAMARQKFAEDRAAVAEKERALEIRAREQQQIHMKVLQRHLEKVSTEMANDLHDGPLSELRGLRFHLNHLRKKTGDAATNASLGDLTGTLLPRMSKHLRKVCGELLLPTFEYGLVPELEKYLDHLEGRGSNLTIQTHWDFDESLWLPKDKGTLFRIFRTLVKNVVDHAQANHLKIELTANAHQTQLVVLDDGIGFNVKESYDALRENKHYGLYMAFFFARGLGGELKIESRPVGGTSAVFLKASEQGCEGGTPG